MVKDLSRLMNFRVYCTGHYYTTAVGDQVSRTNGIRHSLTRCGVSVARCDVNITRPLNLTCGKYSKGSKREAGKMRTKEMSC